MKLSKEDIEKYGTPDERKLLEDNGFLPEEEMSVSQRNYKNGFEDGWKAGYKKGMSDKAKETPWPNSKSVTKLKVSKLHV